MTTPRPTVPFHRKLRETESGLDLFLKLSANANIGCLAQAFENEGALTRLDGFVARHGAAFYGVPVNDGTVTLVRTAAPQPVPDDRTTPEGDLTVFDPLVPIHWAVEG